VVHHLAVTTLALNIQEGHFTIGVTLVLSIFVIVVVAVALVFGMVWYVWDRGSITSRFYCQFNEFV